MSWKLKEFERSMFTVMEVVDEKGEVIKTFVADKLDYEEKKKKAQLIAAAPDLLQAAKLGLQFVIDTPADVCGRDEHIEYIEKKVNKFKGADYNIK